MDHDESAPASLPRVDDAFHTRFGLELSADLIRRASVESFAAHVAALEAVLADEQRAMLTATSENVRLIQGRMQIAAEILERVRNFEMRIKRAVDRAKPPQQDKRHSP